MNLSRIPLKVTYAIMAVLELALRHGTGPTQAKVIARRQAIPVRFTEQILNTLKQAGVVDSLRGAQGGYSLRKDPSALSLAEVVEAMSGAFASLAESSSGRPGEAFGHRAHHGVLLSTIWEQARAAELAVLRSVALKDLIDRYHHLEQERALTYHI